MTVSATSRQTIMLKVLAITDKPLTAIDRLATGLQPYLATVDYRVLAVHPKRPSPAQLTDFERLAADADILDWQYFRTAEMLRARYPELTAQKKQLLTHYNPYSLGESDWQGYDAVVACNREIAGQLPKARYIPLAVDSDYWLYNEAWQPTRSALMVANRIEGKKGILEAAIACGEAGLRLKLVGAISDRDYFDGIIATGAVDFYEQISDSQLRDLYYQAGVHICNSVDNFESGTLPILEAMLCGTPVLTRNVGHVPDLYDRTNLAILDCQPNNVLAIKNALIDLLNDKDALQRQREAGWKTAKSYNNNRRAYQYLRTYRALYPDRPVSVIVPVYDRPEIIRECLNAIANQDYPNIEIIVADDAGSNRQIIADFARTVSNPVLYLDNNRDDYGLARARNRAAIEASSDILVFCDQRMIMAKDCVTELTKNLVDRAWLFGNKGGNKLTFVENLSCIYRQLFFDCGGFSERCDRYGAISQEVRARTNAQGITHVYVDSARAKQAGKSRNRAAKRADIIKSKDWLWKAGLQ